VKRKIEDYGQVIITDNGVPSYELKAVTRPRKTKQAPMPDYYARVIQRQPKPMTAEATRRFHEENRGDC
jgi:antitoxin (DNA-binding transcriptional repressor) of toxin-antitoxin stability system